MTISQALIQLKAFARQDGAIMALIWTASFAFTLLSPQLPWGSLLAIATPFVIGWRLIRFRNYALGGVISFRRALAYSCYTFFYASVLFAVVQYLYFKFLDQGVLMQLMNDTAQVLLPVYKAQGLQETDIREAISMFGSLTPIQLTFMFMMQNIFIGLLLSLPIAAVCTRKNRYGGQKIK